MKRNQHTKFDTFHDFKLISTGGQKFGTTVANRKIHKFIVLLQLVIIIFSRCLPADHK